MNFGSLCKIRQRETTPFEYPRLLQIMNGLLQIMNGHLYLLFYPFLSNVNVQLCVNSPENLDSRIIIKNDKRVKSGVINVDGKGFRF